MAYEIVWLPTAQKRYDEIIGWLQEKWTDREITNFIYSTQEILKSIGDNPALFKKSGKGNIRQVAITKHNLLLYRKKNNKVELLTFFDTRRDPKKKFK